MAGPRQKGHLSTHDTSARAETGDEDMAPHFRNRSAEEGQYTKGG